MYNELRKVKEKAGDYKGANTIKQRMAMLREQELRRTRTNMKQAQQNELQQLDQAQRMLAAQFTNEWDQYMEEYERQAVQGVERLKVKN